MSSTDAESLVLRYSAEMNLSHKRTTQLLWHAKRCKRCLSKLREHFELRDRVDAALAYMGIENTGTSIRLRRVRRGRASA